MGKIAATAAALVLLASGCGSSHPVADSEPAVADGTYEVGVDIEPGVYTTDKLDDAGCSGFSASSREFKVDGPDPEGFLAGSQQVRDQQRIELHPGEFFTSAGCGGWRREDGTGPVSPDPATRAGACTLLVDDALVDDVVAFLANPNGAHGADDRAVILQNRLEAVVFSTLRAEGDAKALGNAGGRLVDLLDDPAAYPDLDRRTLREAGRIRAACKRN